MTTTCTVLPYYFSSIDVVCAIHYSCSCATMYMSIDPWCGRCNPPFIYCGGALCHVQWTVSVLVAYNANSVDVVVDQRLSTRSDVEFAAELQITVQHGIYPCHRSYVEQRLLRAFRSLSDYCSVPTCLIIGGFENLGTCKWYYTNGLLNWRMAHIALGCFPPILYDDGVRHTWTLHSRLPR